jgi:hypothetical protein
VPTYQSKTDSELELLAYGAYLNNKNFNHYYSLATKSFADHYFTTCISYTDNALQTGLANAGIYFLRGKAFKELKDIHSSKKNFKMARKYGDYESKVILKNWKAYIKP